jgi:hypothetical protein
MSWFYEYCKFNLNDWNFDFNTLPIHVQNDAGSFNTYSIEQLLEYNNIIEQPNKIKPLKILYRTNYDNININKFDTSAVQFNIGLECNKNKNNNNVLIQVASNFNCLECSSEYTNPITHKFINGLMFDKTQGPSACGGAIAGTLQRISIHKNNPIDLLSETKLNHINGKLYITENTPTTVEKNKIKIGLQTNVKANFIRTRDYIYNNNGPFIDQVYTSTCIDPKKNGANLSKMLLDCAYEGTYLCGIKQKSKVIVLTLVGNGCFKNNIYFILEAIIQNHIKYSYNMDEIILPIYMPDINLINNIKQYLLKYNFVKFIQI